jgi:hypothetical protein
VERPVAILVGPEDEFAVGGRQEALQGRPHLGVDRDDWPPLLRCPLQLRLVAAGEVYAVAL